jgi:hypothetical protein
MLEIDVRKLLLKIHIHGVDFKLTQPPLVENMWLDQCANNSFRNGTTIVGF